MLYINHFIISLLQSV